MNNALNKVYIGMSPSLSVWQPRNLTLSMRACRHIKISQNWIGHQVVYGYLPCYKIFCLIGLIQSSATNRRKAVYLCL